MKKLFKPACLLFNILTLILFFFIGLLYAGWMEAGKNQGLAAGAIVLGYGVIFAFVALVLSFFVTYRLQNKRIVWGNVIVSVLIAICFILIRSNAEKRKIQRDNNNQGKTTQPTEPVSQVELFAKTNALPKYPSKLKAEMGLGFFKPKLQEEHPMYFYGNPNLEKSLQEHLPTDSIVFKRNEIGFQIASAPPWLMPEHLKLDYDLIYFKVLSLGEEFIQIEGNRVDGYSVYASKWSGELIFWPDFLLNVHAIEPINPSEQKVRIKPLENASLVNISYNLMKPILINESWAKVALLDSNYTKKGEGWIQWKREGQLLVSYSLLS